MCEITLKNSVYVLDNYASNPENARVNTDLLHLIILNYFMCLFLSTDKKGLQFPNDLFF
jgi:hypothetical protein